jgi:hypothetical protein
MYPSTKHQVTPRKRAVGIRPRTFNFYCKSPREHCIRYHVVERNHADWLPNHLLVVHILFLFAVLNPLVTPFGFIYFCVEATVVRNQASPGYYSPATGH